LHRKPLAGGDLQKIAQSRSSLMIIITTVDHHVKPGWRREGGNVNEHESRWPGDVMQLQTLKATYCDIVDACAKDGDRAAECLAGILTEDIQADYGMGPLSGRNAVISFLVRSIVANNESLWHSIHTPRIEVSGDSATAQWTLLVRMKQKGSTTFDTLYGRYFDEFRRTAEGWRISRIRFIQEG
jgi:hypothetical protein